MDQCAPHLRAQISIRRIIDGNSMGLESFLKKEEGMLLGRLLGSVPWMFPLESTVPPPQSPKTEIVSPLPPMTPTVIIWVKSSPKFVIPSQDLELQYFVSNRRHPPSKVRLAIHLGHNTISRTDFVN